MSDTPNVCMTAQHFEECGECADAIGKIVKEEIAALAQGVPVPPAEEEKPKNFDSDGTELSGLMTSHADIPNATDHPIEYGAKCGICVARKRAADQRGQGSAAAVIQAIERL